MDDQEALLHLYLGTAAEQEAALGLLFDRYYGKVVEAVIARCRFDRHDAEIGAADAFIELRRDAATEVPKIEQGEHQPYRWLLDRAASRTTDEFRRNRRILKGAPKALQQDLARQAIKADDADLALPSSREADPVTLAGRAEAVGIARAACFEFLDTLDGVDRGILLHDMVVRYELLSPEDAEAFDEQLIGRSHPDGIYTNEALEKRRQRLTSKLREFLDKRGIR